MPPLREELRVGLDYLESVTTLLQRVRLADATAGLYEAAELQWWWADAAPSTDDTPQLFWFDEHGRPEAAVIATDWGKRVALDPIVMPDATPDWIAHVVARGFAHADESRFGVVGVEVDLEDHVLQRVLTDHGFAIEEDGLVETWLAADARPTVSPLHEDYRLSSRRDRQGPHHMNSARRRHPYVEARLRQTSLYRPDLDLVVYDDRDNVAAYGLFWYDPHTATGLVEPMRTEGRHRRRGLARHILSTGIDLLAQAGADRIKICYELDNQPARDLYLSVGFEPEKQTVVYTRRRSASEASAAQMV